MQARIDQLILGSLLRPQVYALAGTLPPARAFGALALTTLLCAVLLGSAWYVPRAAMLQALDGSALEALPSITIVDGEAKSRDRGPLAFPSPDFVVWLELDASQPSRDALVDALGESERRPIAHVSNKALVLYKPGELPRALSWADLNDRLGSFSVAGPELHSWLGARLRDITLEGTGIAASAALLGQLVLVLLFVLIHGLLFRLTGAKAGAPSGRTLAVAGMLAAIPPSIATTCFGLLGASQGVMIAAYILSGGLLFLVVAGHLRVQETIKPSVSSAPEAGEPLAGLSPQDIDEMLKRGLISEEDASVATELVDS